MKATAISSGVAKHGRQGWSGACRMGSEIHDAPVMVVSGLNKCGGPAVNLEFLSFSTILKMGVRSTTFDYKHVTALSDCEIGERYREERIGEGWCHRDKRVYLF